MLRLPLGPIGVRISTPTPELLLPLGRQEHGFCPPDGAGAPAPAYRLTLRPLRGPTGAHTPSIRWGRTIRGESPLWRIEFEPGARRATAWLPAPPAPYRAGDGVRSALRTFLSMAMLTRGGAALHGAAVVREGVGVVAVGASGAGKTTFAGHFPWDRVLADDLSAVSMGRRGLLVHGTPFRGREGRFGALERARVGVLAVLEQGPTTFAQPLGRAEAVGHLVTRITFGAFGRRVRQRALGVALALADRVPCVRLTVSLEEDPWPHLQRALRDRSTPPCATLSRIRSSAA